MVQKTVLVVVAHTDDETIGMGGTIRKHVDDGDAVYALAMTNGVGARSSSSEASIQNRLMSAEEASSVLGFSWVGNLQLRDNAMDVYPLIDVVKGIEDVKRNLEPDLVYSHSNADLNIDHRVVSQAVMTAFRPQPKEKCTEIRMFEVASATDYSQNYINGSFLPNLYVNILDQLSFKKEALKAYQTEIREYPHTRSIEGIMNLSKLRGNQVGIEFAEAFQVIRKIEL